MSGRRGVGRRNLIGGASMLILMAAEAGVAKAEELDGQLLALCAEYHEKEDEFDRLSDIFDALDRADPEHRRIDAVFTPLVGRIHEIRDEVSEIAARTPEGLRAKAKVSLRELAHGGNLGGGPANEADRVVWSLCCDLLGRAA
ncbi:hypothetical protein [Acidisoma cladoniae]|uniref:hypothetical protein n=1 Tax=Acidisoma cladoniae TaxID=3040935 RepID=UPI00254C37C7|nr:hypothetical protein [Acidisoma sp. PAMC 29798]